MNAKIPAATMANPDLARADQERRRSSAAMPQDRGRRRQKSRADAKRAAIRDAR